MESIVAAADVTVLVDDQQYSLSSAAETETVELLHVAKVDAADGFEYAVAVGPENFQLSVHLNLLVFVFVG